MSQVRPIVAQGIRLVMLTSLALVVCGCPRTPADAPTPAPQTMEVSVFLVCSDSSQTRGLPFGFFGEVLVPVRRTVASTEDPLKAAVDQLLSMPQQFDAGGVALKNYWIANDNPALPALHVESVSLADSVATIHIVGGLSVAGVGDIDRIVMQIQTTARQFPSVKTATVLLNGTPLEEAIAF